MQYVSLTDTERLAEAGIAPSVGSVGDSCANALALAIIGLFKTEVIRYRGPWRSLEAVALAPLALGLLPKAAASLAGLLRCRSQGVDWFDQRRLLEPIGFVPPAEAEAAFHHEPAGTKLAAQDANQTAFGKPGAVQRQPEGAPGGHPIAA